MESNFQPDDIVFSNAEIRNDGSFPELHEDALIAAEGTRGVVINEGHLEEFPDKTLYLVRFDGAKDVLGPAVGVWPEELTQEPLHENIAGA